MAAITNHSEPRSSLLWAIYFTGITLTLAAGKGHLGSWAGEIGKWLTIGSVVAFVLRAWYMWRQG